LYSEEDELGGGKPVRGKVWAAGKMFVRHFKPRGRCVFLFMRARRAAPFEQLYHEVFAA
jgi:hypothetical protein